MKWAGALIGLLREALGFAREERARSDRDHERALDQKADIDRRHVERRDLSKDPRPR